MVSGGRRYHPAQPRTARYRPWSFLIAMEWRLALSFAAALTASSCAVTDLAPIPAREEQQPTTHQMTHHHHTIDYIELTVVSVAEAKRFYANAFGWEFNDYGPDYAGIKKVGGGEVGGLRQDATVVRGGPLVVLYSDDLEASVNAVVDAGGQIVQEPFAFPGGRRFHFTDPAGNELAVASYK